MQQFIPNGNLGACIAPAGPRAPSSLPRWPSGSHRQQAHLTSHAPRFSPSRGPAGQGCHASPKASVHGWVRHPSERLGGRTVCPRCPCLWPREGAEPWAAAAAASLCIPPAAPWRLGSSQNGPIRSGSRCAVLQSLPG